VNSYSQISLQRITDQLGGSRPLGPIVRIDEYQPRKWMPPGESRRFEKTFRCDWIIRNPLEIRIPSGNSRCKQPVRALPHSSTRDPNYLTPVDRHRNRFAHTRVFEFRHPLG